MFPKVTDKPSACIIRCSIFHRNLGTLQPHYAVQQHRKLQNSLSPPREFLKFNFHVVLYTQSYGNSVRINLRNFSQFQRAHRWFYEHFWQSILN